MKHPRGNALKRMLPAAALLLPPAPGPAWAEEGPASLARPQSVVDRARATRPPVEDTLWYDLRELEIEGRGWD